MTMKTSARPFHRIALGVLALLFFDAPVSATRLIPFQGRVTDGGGQPLEGVFRVTFAIYDEATGGQALYAESHADVSVIGGQINVLLGSLVSLDDPNGDGDPGDTLLFDDTLRPRYLGIKVGDETNQEMVPRHQLVPSFHSRIADTTVAGGVDTEQLADGAVTTAKIDPAVLLPAGAIMPYGGTTAPVGWVLCDGQEYDGTLPEFTSLFDAIGTSFGGGGTTFRVPDLRGQFLRGVDAGAGIDPDAAERTGGDVVGSTQGSAVVALSGTTAPGSASTAAAGGHTHAEKPNFNVNDAFGPTALAADVTSRFTTKTFDTEVAGSHVHTIAIPSLNLVVEPTQGATVISTEVRPANIAVNYICKL